MRDVRDARGERGARNVRGQDAPGQGAQGQGAQDQGAQRRWLDLGVVLVAALLAVTTVAGVAALFGRPAEATVVQSQYGAAVTLWGGGIYARDSLFQAPIFIGTDFVMLVLALPLLLVSWRKARHGSRWGRLVLMAALSLICYYGASLAFGVTYNALLVVYIALMGLSLFCLVAEAGRYNHTGERDTGSSFSPQQPPVLPQNGRTTPLKRGNHEPDGLATMEIADGETDALPRRVAMAFCIVSGVALIGAWLPDIISSYFSGQPPAYIGLYSTEITYALDMGIISPCLFLCAYLLHRRRASGVSMLCVLLVVCILVGVMLPVQTVVQLAVGIQLAPAAIVAKVASFVVLAGWAALLLRKVGKTLDNTI